jgi:hypothetical protein
MGLFHAGIEEFLDNSTAQTIDTYISSHRKAIANSVKKYTAASQAGVTSVVQWIRGWSNNGDIIEKIHARQRKRFTRNRRTEERETAYEATLKCTAEIDSGIHVPNGCTLT